jgi:hypothetical protein
MVSGASGVVTRSGRVAQLPRRPARQSICRNESLTDDFAKLPPGLFLESPPVRLPVRAVGGMVMDANGQTIANCPNASLADVVAWSINVLNGVHP